jgi:hypothetical protein
MMFGGLIYKYAKMVLLPPQTPHPLHYLIGLEAKDPSFHASPPSSPPSSTTTSNPRLPVFIMPLIILYDHNAFFKMVWGPKQKFLHFFGMV